MSMLYLEKSTIRYLGDLFNVDLTDVMSRIPQTSVGGINYCPAIVVFGELGRVSKKAERVFRGILLQRHTVSDNSELYITTFYWLAKSMFTITPTKSGPKVEEVRNAKPYIGDSVFSNNLVAEYVDPTRYIYYAGLTLGEKVVAPRELIRELFLENRTTAVSRVWATGTVDEFYDSVADAIQVAKLGDNSEWVVTEVSRENDSFVEIVALYHGLDTQYFSPMVFGNKNGEWTPLLQRAVINSLYETIIIPSLSGPEKEEEIMEFTLGELILALNGNTTVDTTDISVAVTALLLWCKEECGDIAYHNLLGRLDNEVAVLDVAANMTALNELDIGDFLAEGNNTSKNFFAVGKVHKNYFVHQNKRGGLKLKHETFDMFKDLNDYSDLMPLGDLVEKMFDSQIMSRLKYANDHYTWNAFLPFAAKHFEDGIILPNSLKMYSHILEAKAPEALIPIYMSYENTVALQNANGMFALDMAKLLKAYADGIPESE